MSTATKITEKKILRELVPLNTLSKARFEEISGKIIVEEVRAGGYLFRRDDRDMQTVFLLGGEIALLGNNQKPSGTIKAGSDKSFFPVADTQPRILSACAVKKCIIARIDSSLLEAFLSWDQSNDAEAVAIGANEDEDWMTRMLQSQAFEKIPPAKIQQLLLKMDAVRFKAGATVIRQGEPGDSFYTIKSGKCAVTRKDTPQGEEQVLAELADGDCFGEEALVQDVKRNATVSMLTDGVLMRLAKQDFVELLQKPLVRYVDYEKAVQMIDEGAIWVDVRGAAEYDGDAIEDSVNIPLSSVRREMHDLVFNVAYILCCDTGQSSASAAFILSHKGFDVYVLENGLRALPENTFQHIPGSPQAVPEVAAGIDESGQLASAAEGRIAELQQQLEQVHESHALDKSGMQKEMDDLTARKNETIETKERECVELKQQQSRLQEDLDAVRNEREGLQQILDSAVNDAAGSQQEIDALNAQLARDAEEHERSATALQEERDALQRNLDEALGAVAGRQQMIDTLHEQVTNVTAGSEEHVQGLDTRLETMQMQLEEANRQAADRLVQLNGMLEKWSK